MAPKWAKKLTKRELAHLRCWSPTRRPTLKSLRENLRWQKQNGARCSECAAIAQKLRITE